MRVFKISTFIDKGKELKPELYTKLSESYSISLSLGAECGSNIDIHFASVEQFELFVQKLNELNKDK